MSVNKTILVGRLGKDPVLSKVGDRPVANFSVATTEKWKDKQTGEKKEATEWHNIVIWGTLGETAAKHLTKGSLVYLEGKGRTRSYAKDGVTHYTHELLVDSMQMLSINKPTEVRDTPSGDDLPF